MALRRTRLVRRVLRRAESYDVPILRVLLPGKLRLVLYGVTEATLLARSSLHFPNGVDRLRHLVISYFFFCRILQRSHFSAGASSGTYSVIGADRLFAGGGFWCSTCFGLSSGSSRISASRWGLGQRFLAVVFLLGEVRRGGSTSVPSK